MHAYIVAYGNKFFQGTNGQQIETESDNGKFDERKHVGADTAVHKCALSTPTGWEHNVHQAKQWQEDKHAKKSGRKSKHAGTVKHKQKKIQIQNKRKLSRELITPPKAYQLFDALLVNSAEDDRMTKAKTIAMRSSMGTAHLFRAAMASKNRKMMREHKKQISNSKDDDADPPESNDNPYIKFKPAARYHPQNRIAGAKPAVKSMAGGSIPPVVRRNMQLRKKQPPRMINRNKKKEPSNNINLDHGKQQFRKHYK